MVFHKNLTVIYYTSNREEESFEEKIKDSLVEVIGDTPLISVSQKPIDFGENICVGDIGCSDRNVFKQLLIGCEEAKTPFVATAEADCLYPKTGYFDYKPDRLDMAYRCTNLWIMYWNKDLFYKKGYSLCSQIAGREYLIYFLERRLKVWDKDRILDVIPWKDKWQSIENKIPCINIKTGNSMRARTGTSKHTKPVAELPYWGRTKELKEKLWM